MTRLSSPARSCSARGLAGGALLTVPGLLAACGSSGSKAACDHDRRQAAAREDAALLELDALHRHEQQDEVAPVARTSSRRSTASHVDYVEDINDNASFFGKIQGPLSRGQSIDRDIIVLTDNDRYLSLMIKKGWAEKLDKSAIPNIKNLVAGPAAPDVRPEPRVQRCRGSPA